MIEENHPSLNLGWYKNSKEVIVELMFNMSPEITMDAFSIHSVEFALISVVSNSIQNPRLVSPLVGVLQSNSILVW